MDIVSPDNSYVNDPYWSPEIEEDQDALQRSRLFHTLLGDGLDGLWDPVWRARERLTEWVQNPDEATECSAGRDIFVGVGLADAPRGMTKRLTNETAAGLLGVIADVDIFWEGKPSEALPRNWKEAREFVESLDVPPTLLIHSGHGAHCWWLFSQPWRFGDGDHDRAADLSYRWQAYINLRAAEHGWRLDSIGDLARILRVPGTVNGKGGGGAPWLNSTAVVT